MTNHRFHPALNKKRVLAHAEFTVYSVNGLAVRNFAQPDEEFGNFATREEFPNLICSKVEYKLRKGEGAAFLLVTGRRKLSKADLPRLTGEEVFRSVVSTYVRN
jgi:hypothetical protein